MSTQSSSLESSERPALSPIRFIIQFSVSIVKYLATLIAGYLSLSG